ncbi:MAG: hypothetical protein AAF466_04825 [Bacteroidota bacterium]
MHWFKKIISFYVDASVHVALAVTSLAWITVLEFGFERSWEVMGFIFFGTITGYNFVKYAPVAGWHHKTLTSSLKAIQLFSFLCAPAGLYFLIVSPVEVWYTVLPLAVLTFFYAIPFLHGSRRTDKGSSHLFSLRSLSGLKIFVVGMVWAGATVLIPWAGSGEVADGIGYTLLQRFLFVIAWTLPFEIRDLAYDRPSLGTLPQLLGVERTKWLGYVLLLGCVVVELLKPDGAWAQLISCILIAVISAVFIFRSKKEQSRYFASFWVESIPIVWMFIFLFLYAYLESS